MCGRFNRIYKRPFNQSMAEVLRLLYNARHSKKYVHLYNDAEAKSGGEYAQMKFWGLIKANEKTEGEWEITDEGCKFIEGEATITERVVTINDHLLGFSGKEITYIQAAKIEFSKDHLLAA